MAVCVPLRFGAVEHAFAVHDSMMKYVSLAANDGEAIKPADRFYTAPAEIVTRKRRGREPEPFLVFSCYETSRYHKDAAKFLLKERGLEITVLGSVEEVHRGLLGGGPIPDSRIAPLQRQLCAEGEDVCLALEQEAYEAACAAVGDTTRSDWRDVRAYECSELLAGTEPESVPLHKLRRGRELDAEEKAEKEALEAVVRKKREHQCSLERSKRYIATADEFAMKGPDGDICRFEFETEGGRKRCVYDRKGDSPFCSACIQAIAFLADNREEVEAHLENAKRARR